MNIIYTCQENYALIAGISIYSLLKENPDNKIQIYFLDSNLSERSKEKYQKMCLNHGNAHISFLNVNNLLNQYVRKMMAYQNSYAAYSKVFLEMLLPKTVEKCLYIDADTIITGQLSSIFDEQDNIDKTLAMHPDTMHQYYRKRLGFANEDPYYNAGVIYVNLNAWRKKNYSKKIIQLLQNGPQFSFADQDIINLVFRNDISRLKFSDNLFTQCFLYKLPKDCKKIFGLNDLNYYEDSECRFDSPRIIHFTTHPCIIRPWFAGSLHPYAKKYKELVEESPFSAVFEFKTIEQPFWRAFIQCLMGEYGTKRYRFFALCFGILERNYLNLKHKKDRI